ncbi:hypothetical protein [Schaalia sp. lx-100]|uniref:hypothetical protein n=1 Tax=Schaalia sp. lx-100 TaxID=2899081 RepID=UPI001E33F6F0|nr:hypothetical protein [Schaalia sp. lx-100]MCD4557970.1 hypothetical protein [Schaalia sp. lx-100]
MLLKRRVVSALLCAFLALSIAGCANTSTQGLLGSAESVKVETGKSSESGSNATVVVESRDEQPEASRQWFALSREERREKIREAMKHEISCLEDKGWKIEKVDLKDLGYTVEPQEDPAMRTQVAADINECNALNPSPDADIVMSVADIEDIYNYNLNVRDCLEKEGIAVTTPPTKQKYIDDFRNDRVTWSPYTDLMNASDLTADRFREITEKCPQW